MKLCHLIYIIWCILRRAQGASHEDNLRESDNTVIEGLALENTELENADSKVDSHMEMLSDFQDSIKEESEVHEESFVRPQGRLHFTLGPPLELAMGEQTFCGPYRNHYTKRQDCVAVGHYYHELDRSRHVTVRECELHCEKVFGCNAINWSNNWEAGCVLRECGASGTTHPPKPFPMPIGYKWDWFSFSKFQPDEIPECKKEHGSYDTPN